MGYNEEMIKSLQAENKRISETLESLLYEKLEYSRERAEMVENGDRLKKIDADLIYREAILGEAAIIEVGTIKELRAEVEKIRGKWRQISVENRDLKRRNIELRKTIAQLDDYLMKK